jgi:hypothetical protein
MKLVLLLAKVADHALYKPECFIDLSLDVAMKYESDICTDLMKYDENISDVLVYSSRTFDSDSLPKSLQDLPVYHNSWPFSLPIKNEVKHD